MALGIPALLVSITTLCLQIKQMKRGAAIHANDSNNPAMPGLGPDPNHHPNHPNVNNAENTALGNMDNRRGNGSVTPQQQRHQRRNNTIESSANHRPRRRTGAGSSTATASARQLLQPSSPDSETEPERFTGLDSEGTSERGIMLRSFGRGPRSSRLPAGSRRGGVHEEVEEPSAAEDADAETDDNQGDSSRSR